MPEEWTYTLTAEDWKAIFRGVVVERGVFDSAAKREHTKQGFSAIAGVLVWVVFMTYRAWTTTTPMTVLVLSVVLAASVALFTILTSKTALRRSLAARWFEAWVVSSRGWSRDRTPVNRLQVNTNGVVFHQSLDDRRQVVEASWKDVRTIVRLEGFVVIVLRSTVLVPVPMKVMAPDRVDVTLAQWEAWRAATEPELDAEFAQQLAASKAKCPACRYDLVGLTRRQCPECGQRLAFSGGRVVED